MIYFYKIKDNKAITGTGNKLPEDSFTEYNKDNKPQELINALAYKTPKEIAAQTKAELQSKLKEITVTTSNGNTFDGDDTARADMMSAISASATLGLTEHNWKLADDTWKIIQLSELKEAQALAIQRKGQILNGED